MIIQEPFENTDLIRTYSDEGYYIIQHPTEAQYTEAIDVQPLQYTYSESEEKINYQSEIINEDLETTK